MTLTALKASRALWLARERFRYNKWHFYRFESKRAESERLALRKKWWDLYEEARDNRVRRDKQIAAASKASNVSPAGVALIKEFEGFPYGGRPYRDAVGVWTIGYGHTEHVGPNSKPLSEREASALLLSDLNKEYAPYVRALKLPLNQNQFDALVSFVYNVGPGGVEPTTQVGKALRAHNWQSAADHLLDWDKAAGRTLAGLTRRRQAERKLFLKP